MRAVVQVEEINKRTCLVVTELPYQVNPDNLALKIAELVKDGKIKGIADVRDEGNERLGQRLVIVLQNSAIPKVILNNLYKQTQLQDTFGANMLALVDGVPRTLRLDEFIRYYIEHQVEVIVRRTKFRLAEKEKRAHSARLPQSIRRTRCCHRFNPRKHNTRRSPHRFNETSRRR
jgi:DNA gyrase subunit A